MEFINLLMETTKENNRLDNGIVDLAWKWGSLEIAWYGILAFFGFIVAIGFAFGKTKWWYKIPMEPIYWFAFIAIPMSILGARSWSFIIGDAEFNSEYGFWARFLQFFGISRAAGVENAGGLAIQGGVLFVLAAGLIYFPLVLRKPKFQIKTLKDGVQSIKPVSSFCYADIIIPCVLIGQAIGRWGNFINGELYGMPVTDGSLDWLKVVMPAVYRGMQDTGDLGVVYHPLFLYESFADVCLFAFLYVACEFIPGRKAGDISAGYFIGYGIIRLSMEPFRDAHFNFTATYVLTGIQIAASIAFILYNHLWFCNHRDIKYIYEFWIKFSWMFKKMWSVIWKPYRNKLSFIDPDGKNYGFNKRPEFRRKPTEILYYGGH